MDIEQLKLLIDAAKAISGDASTVVYWWIILKISTVILTDLLVFVAVMLTVWCAYRVLSTASHSVTEIQALASRLGIDNYDAWYGPDRRKLNDAVNRLLSK